MGQDQKHVKDLEADRGHGEEVDGDQLLGMILKECPPGLRRRFAAAHRSTPIWWRGARFSSWRPARERKIEDRIARSVAREMSIRGE